MRWWQGAGENADLCQGPKGDATGEVVLDCPHQLEGHQLRNHTVVWGFLGVCPQELL